MWTVVLSLLLLLYFIRGQFGFERPSRIRYWIIPLFSLVMFIATFKVTVSNSLLAVAILVVGVCIGVYQAHFAQIRPLATNDQSNRVEVRGGIHYLIGWGLILVIQIGAEVIFAHEHLEISSISKEAFQSVIEEILPFRRLHGGGWWVLWDLSASASLAYTLVLVHRSPGFRATIKRHARRNLQRANRKRM